MKIATLSIFLLVAFLSSAATNTVELPVETFFRYPELSQMSLAPDGKYLAAIAYDRTNSFLFGINLQSGERKAIFTGGVYHFRWLTNERLLFWAGGVGAGGLYAINRDGSKVKVLQLPYVTQILKSYSLHLQLTPIEYKSRDGLTIHGYLTLPVGCDAKHLPLVVMPHGGPWVRDNWGFNPEVEFFANRGYAVLQTNFRRSTGYGLAFSEAGNKQWGRKMQDDISDGVNWAVSEGIADRNRVAIFGASYGGYAALMGLIFTPDLYRCGVCYAGVTDIASLLKRPLIHLPKKFEDIEKEMIGDYRQEKEDLNAVSPLYHVDKIRAPLFLAYGGRDPIVPIEQGNELAKALRKAGKKFEMMVEPHEGHGFANETNRFKLFRRVEEFLKNNL